MQIPEYLEAFLALDIVWLRLQPLVHVHARVRRAFHVFSIDCLMQYRWQANDVVGVLQLLRRNVVCIGAALSDDVMILLASPAGPNRLARSSGPNSPL